MSTLPETKRDLDFLSYNIDFRHAYKTAKCEKDVSKH